MAIGWTPLFNAYLYGAYFFDFIARRYGQDAVRKLVESYSGNLLPFRLHTVPLAVTGKTMDALYVEFIDDLTRELDSRAAPILSAPAEIGEPVGEGHREVFAVAMGKGAQANAIFAVTDDGITEPLLQRFASESDVSTLGRARYGTRIDVRQDGAVLASQIEICEGHDVYFDLYLFAAGTQEKAPSRLTRCGRYFRGVWSAGGEAIYALKHSAGVQSLVRLDAKGANERVLLAGTPHAQWLDVAAAADGRKLALIGKHAASFALYEFDLGTSTLRLRHADGAFKHSPHYQGDTLYFLSTVDNVFNVWRLTPEGELQRVTHAHTAITSFGGVDDRGRIALAVLDKGKIQIRRAGTGTPLQSAQARADLPVRTPAESQLPPLDAPVALKNETRYSALSTLTPRSWFPLLFADRDTLGVGVSTFGSDALGWHRYYAAPIFEVTQREPLGVFEYVYHDRHYLTLDRNLVVTQWREEDKRDKATEYERSMQAQWVSLSHLIRWDYRVNGGIGAAIEQKDRVTIDGPTRDLDDERIAAGLLEYESMRENIYSEGPSQGWRARVLYETYRPFNGSTRFDGDVWRMDLSGYFALGKAVLALRGVEACASGRTENFELGDSFSELHGEAPRLNERRLALRGYSRGLAVLRGEDARLGSVEGRFPLADIDRHAMVPPIGINRLSTVLFFDVGQVSSNGISGRYYRGLGVELLGELRLGYLFGAHVRAGITWGLNDPGDTQAYLQVGRSF